MLVILRFCRVVCLNYADVTAHVVVDVVGVSVGDFTENVDCTGNAFDMYSGGSRFESWLRHWFFMVLLGSTGEKFAKLS